MKGDLLCTTGPESHCIGLDSLGGGLDARCSAGDWASNIENWLYEVQWAIQHGKM